MKLITCQDCFNSYYTTETNCPHCTSGSPAPRVPLALLLGLGLSACEELTPETKAVYGVEIVDEDGDGFEAEVDCDDLDALTYPGSAELDSETECMTDLDGDGFGDDSPLNPDVIAGTDCDDSDPNINPAAENCT